MQWPSRYITVVLGNGSGVELDVVADLDEGVIKEDGTQGIEHLCPIQLLRRIRERGGHGVPSLGHGFLSTLEDLTVTGRRDGGPIPPVLWCQDFTTGMTHRYSP